MRSWQTREELEAQIVSLSTTGTSFRAIARALGVSRNTVRKVLAAHGARRDEQPHTALPPKPERAPRKTKLDVWHGSIDDLIARYPDITAQRVFEELRDAGYDGGLTAVKDRMRRVRRAPLRTPSLPVQPSGPAELAESDWSPYTIAFTHAPRAVVQAFSYVLCYSTRKHFGFFERSDFHALMDGHVAAFDRFDGAAHACKYDGQKAVVLGWEGSQPIFNPRFVAFATHYEFRPVACRPRRPNDKPRTERSFWELERSFFNGRSFRDLADLRAQLAGWLDTTCDLRPRRSAPKTPRMELFAEEQPLLRRLPRHPYDTARVVYRLCSIDGFVSWEGNRYAVPYEHITSFLPVRITADELLAYAPDLRCVARHGLAARGGGRDVGASEYHPRPHQERRPAADLDQLRGAFGDMGEAARAFLDALELATGRQAAHHARRILLLRERYSTDDLCAALRHAHSYGAWEHQCIERILLARATPRRLAEYVDEALADRLARNLGAVTTTPRDLTEYDRLPVTTHAPQETPWPDAPIHPSETPSSKGSDDPLESLD
jgi:transposase